jgi:hypothetical protein
VRRVASWAVATAEDDDQRQGSDEAVGSEMSDDSRGSCGTQKERGKGDEWITGQGSSRRDRLPRRLSGYSKDSGYSKEMLKRQGKRTRMGCV